MTPCSIFSDLLLHLSRVEQMAELRRCMLWQTHLMDPYSLYKTIAAPTIDATLLLGFLSSHDHLFSSLQFIPNIA